MSVGLGPIPLNHTRHLETRVRVHRFHRRKEQYATLDPPFIPAAVVGVGGAVTNYQGQPEVTGTSETLRQCESDPLEHLHRVKFRLGYSGQPSTSL